MSLTTGMIARSFWRAFGVVFFVFLGLQFLFRFLDQVDKVQMGFSLGEIIFIALAGSVRGLYQELPMVTLISTAVAMGGLAQTSELTVLRSAGLSTRRLFGKLAYAMTPLLAVTLGLAQVGLPEAERMQQILKREGSSTLWTRDTDRFVFVRGDLGGSVSQWKHLQLAPEGRQIGAITESRNIRFETGQVILEPATQLVFSEEKLSRESITLKFDSALRPSDLRWLLQPPGVLSVSDLYRGALYLDSQQLNSAPHSLLFWQRILMPGLILAIALLGFVSAFGSLRSVPMSTRVFVAVVVGIGFKLVSDVLTPIILLTGVAPVWGAVIPIILLLIGARFAYR